MVTRLVSVLVVLCCALCGFAEEYERRLIPVTAGLTQGAFGTRWTTVVTAVQELQNGVEIVGDLTISVPPWVCCSSPYRLFPPPTVNEPPGSILHILKESAPDVHVAARLRLDRNSIMHEETVLPVVAESEFVAGTLYFLQLTNRADERVHLRVYSLDVDHANPGVRVRVQATWEGKIPGGYSLVHEATHSLTVRQKYTPSIEHGGQFPLRPLALELTLDPIRDTLPEGAEIAISVVPLADGLRLWGMVSETHNATQRVRIVVPE